MVVVVGKGEERREERERSREIGFRSSAAEKKKEKKETEIRWRKELEPSLEKNVRSERVDLLVVMCIELEKENVSGSEQARGNKLAILHLEKMLPEQRLGAASRH